MTISATHHRISGITRRAETRGRCLPIAQPHRVAGRSAENPKAARAAREARNAERVGSVDRKHPTPQTDRVSRHSGDGARARGTATA